MTVTIDKAGRIVLPKKLRVSLNLEPGTEFHIAKVGSRIQLEPVQPKGKMVYTNGIPIWVSQGPKVDYDFHAAIMEDYERRADFISGRFGYDRDDLL